MKPLSIISSFSLALLLTQAGISSMAADLIVEENGVFPNYASIPAAILAASPGDRIFVKNRPGGWTGAVDINKPVSVLAFQSNGTFDVSGSWTITADAAQFSPAQKSVRIVGMNNSAGGISGVNSAGTPVMVDVHGSRLGAISLFAEGFEARITGNVISGSVLVRAAHIIGNQFLSGGVLVAFATTVSSLGDTLYIVGNRFATEAGSSVSTSIGWDDDKHYFHIANNWVFGSSENVLEIANARSGPGTNFVTNNSFRAGGLGFVGRVVVISTTEQGAHIVFGNNALRGDGSGGVESGVHVTNSSLPRLELTYNVFGGSLQTFQTGGATGSQVGNQGAAFTLNPNSVTGVCTDVLCVNGGNPAADFIDHDGTRNDVGVSGGSFNHSNFWPLQTGSARVFLVKTPRVALPGATIQAEAAAVDR